MRQYGFKQYYNLFTTYCCAYYAGFSVIPSEWMEVELCNVVGKSVFCFLIVSVD
jgi:hypothetical protein